MAFHYDRAAELLLLREALAAELIPAPQARSATDGDDTALLEDYARDAFRQHAVLGRLRGQLPWLTATRPGAWLLLPAVLAGALFSGLTAGGRFNILAPPLLGLLAWQLLVYVLLLLPRASSGQPDSRPLRRGLLALGRSLGVRLGGGGRAAGVATRTAMAFAAAAPQRLGGTLAATLHAAAAAFALGAIGGLYWDGLGVAYQAYWESTFLGATTVTAIIGVLLTPASWVTGIDLPDAAAVAALGQQPVPAAPWIHLWAATLAWTVILPRILLAAAALLRVHRVREVSLDLAEPGFARLLANLRGRGIAALVQPVGYRPSPASLERLRTRLDEALHGAVRVTVADSLPWGTEAIPDAADGTDRLVLLLNPAQTPEEEVHGPLLADAAGRGPLTVVLDAAAYRTSADRRASRVAGWQRLLEDRDIDWLELEA